jgi:predicted nucleic-acid-binding Zn-ribbon protein
LAQALADWLRYTGGRNGAVEKKEQRAVDYQIRTFSPCPKCGSERVDTDGTFVGLEYAKSVPVVCLSCGYIEFYAKPEMLERIKKMGSYAAFEKAQAEAKARKAEQEGLEQAKKPQKRRFF